METSPDTFYTEDQMQQMLNSVESVATCHIREDNEGVTQAAKEMAGLKVAGNAGTCPDYGIVHTNANGAAQTMSAEGSGTTTADAELQHQAQNNQGQNVTIQSGQPPTSTQQSGIPPLTHGMTGGLNQSQSNMMQQGSGTIQSTMMQPGITTPSTGGLDVQNNAQNNHGGLGTIIQPLNNLVLLPTTQQSTRPPQHQPPTTQQGARQHHHHPQARQPPTANVTARGSGRHQRSGYELRQERNAYKRKRAQEEERSKHQKAAKLAKKNDLKAAIENFVLRSFCLKATHSTALEAYVDSLTEV